MLCAARAIAVTLVSSDGNLTPNPVKVLAIDHQLCWQTGRHLSPLLMAPMPVTEVTGIGLSIGFQGE